MYITLLFVLFPYIMRKYLTARCALDLNFKEVCVRDGILNMFEEINDS